MNSRSKDQPHIFEHRATPPERLCCICQRPPVLKPITQARNKATAKYPSCDRPACNLEIARKRRADQREKAKRKEA